jgi:hypothetical protein
MGARREIASRRPPAWRAGVERVHHFLLGDGDERSEQEPQQVSCQPYIVVNDMPKLGQLKKEFPELYR